MVSCDGSSRIGLKDCTKQCRITADGYVWCIGVDFAEIDILAHMSRAKRMRLIWRAVEIVSLISPSTIRSRYASM